MSGKLIIITSDDKIKTADYEDFTSISKAVNGSFERFYGIPLPVDPILCNGQTHILCDLYCNDEFFYRNDGEFKKANAVAMIMTGNAHIRGNVVLIPSIPEQCDNRGFEYREFEEDGEIAEDLCECWSAEDTLMLYVNQHADVIDDIHKKFDKEETKHSMGICLE